MTDRALAVRAGETTLLRSPASVTRAVSGDVSWFAPPAGEAPGLRRWAGIVLHDSRRCPNATPREELPFVGWSDGVSQRAEGADPPSAAVKQGRGIGFQPVTSPRKHDRLEAYPTFLHNLSAEMDLAAHGTGSRVAVASLAAAILAAWFLAPTEATMGHAQRILYVHVPVAWLGLLAFLMMAGSGVAYWVRRDLKWDHWFQAANEIGWLCSGLTLATGALWAREAWGSWWEWEPRLTTAFILWAVCSGILLVRSGLEDPHRRARFGAVLAVLGGLDVPLVVMATRWFRGLHPVAPEMTPLMRLTLLISVVGFTVFFVWLAGWRRAQLDLESRTAELQRQTEC